MSVQRVLVCDDHWIVRQAIRQRVDEIHDFETVGEADNGAQVTAEVERLQPDLLIIDIEMPGSNGLDAMARVLEVRPETKVLIFTAHEEDNLVRLAAREGARGFLSKSSSPDQIRAACEALARGETWFPDLPEEPDEPDELARLRSLTEREREILTLLASGMRAQGVADAIGIRTATVYTHVRNIVGKLGVDTRTQAVAIATRYSFLESERQVTR